MDQKHPSVVRVKPTMGQGAFVVVVAGDGGGGCQREKGKIFAKPLTNSNVSNTYYTEYF